MVGRGQFQAGLPPDVLIRVFLANPDKLPAYTGATNERGGFSIVRVLKVCHAGGQRQGTRRHGDVALVGSARPRSC